MGRNRDAWVANGAPQGLWAHASDWVAQSPDFGPTRRAETRRSQRPIGSSAER
ncbi:MAG: hypothetical protein LBV61_03210 [Burkholderiaceae bacterium]|nr:hypothetical protein [Burkholderiaceae bacterium]